MTEKITTRVDLHLPERMLRDVQDAAMSDDRKVSEFIRHVLSLHLYGVKGSQSSQEANGANRGEEGRSDG